MHPRKLIRNALKARLLGQQGDYATTAAERVFATMTPPTNIDSLIEDGPVILVYTRGETIKPENYPKTGQDGAVKRTLEVFIEIIAAGGEDIDGTLDDVAEVVEGLLENWEVPEKPMTELRLIETQIDVTDAQDRIVGGAFLQYECDYWSEWRKPADDSFEIDKLFAKLPGVGVRELLLPQGEVVEQ